MVILMSKGDTCPAVRYERFFLVTVLGLFVYIVVNDSLPVIIIICQEVIVLDDAGLIQRLKKRKQKALIQVMDFYGGYVYTIVKNIIGDCMQPEDIEETVSDVFYKLWINIDKVENGKPLKPYLIGMARNMARNKLREHKLMSPLEEAEMIQEDVLCEEMERKEQIQIIKEVLWGLPEMEREIFIRYYYNYEKIKDIAEKYHVSPSKVKMSLHRIRKLLKTELEGKGYGYGT